MTAPLLWLVCTECGGVAQAGAAGWYAELVEVDPGVVVIRCPGCGLSPEPGSREILSSNRSRAVPIVRRFRCSSACSGSSG